MRYQIDWGLYGQIKSGGKYHLCQTYGLEVSRFFTPFSGQPLDDITFTTSDTL